VLVVFGDESDGLQPWSRPRPDYRREEVIFKPCGCW